jgi:hypothetical protein
VIQALLGSTVNLTQVYLALLSKLILLISVKNDYSPLHQLLHYPVCLAVQVIRMIQVDLLSLRSCYVGSLKVYHCFQAFRAAQAFLGHLAGHLDLYDQVALADMDCMAESLLLHK